MDLLEKQEEHQKQRDENDRLWREKQAEQERGWRKEDRGQINHHHHMNLLVFGLLFILVQVVLHLLPQR